MTTAVVIVAGGSGSRMGTDVKKQFQSLCGVPVIVRSLQLFSRQPMIGTIVAVVPESDIESTRKLLNSYELECVVITAGGKRRQDSVRNGLQLIQGENRVIIHDAARPLTSDHLIDSLLAVGKLHPAVICAIPVTDTIKQIDDTGHVTGTIPRDCLRAVQTPQLFDATLLRMLVEEFDAVDVSDDAAFFELKGIPVYCIMGEETNIKLTTQADLLRAQLIIEQRMSDV